MKLNQIIFYIKNKKYYFVILLLLFILFLFYFYGMRSLTNNMETFIGKGKSSDDLDDLDNNDSKKNSYKSFPPTSKYDLLNDIFGKNQPGKEKSETDVKGGVKEIPIRNLQIQEQPKLELEKSDLQKNVSKLDDAKALLGKCDFYPNKCPNGMSSVTSLTGSNMKCSPKGEGGEGGEGRVAKAVAEIQSGHLSKIIVIDGGSGYNQENPPNVKIEGGQGSMNSDSSSGSASAEVGSDGQVKSIDIINYGYNYMETPKVVIEPPQMASVCHLCC
jgi:hypothetical protein